MFWRPAYVAQSAWLEHVPFAFWLVETHRPRVIVELGTHYGVSYFSFCQAVDRLGLDARCFAIDTWKGDEHAGFYSEEVFAAVREYNDEQYSTFSRLVRSTFDEAAGHFLPSSIDLLHIDGLHTFEAVSHDFETWLPKLSEDAVVLFHDTNVRERDFEVSAFFQKLKAHYWHFEFVHGHGLGVLYMGKGGRCPTAALQNAKEDSAFRHAICDIFARLGRSVADVYALKEANKRIHHLQRHSEEHQQLLASRLSELSTLSDDLVRERDNSLQAEARAATHLDALQKLSRGHEEVLARLGEIDESYNELLQKSSKLKRLLGEKEDEIVLRDKSIEHYVRSLDSRFFELAILTEDLEREKEAISKVEERATAHLSSLKTAEKRRRSLATEHDSLKKTHQALAAKYDKLEQNYTALVQKHEVIKGAEQRRQSLATEHGALNQAHRALRKSFDELNTENGDLVRYARKLERDLSAVLKSTSWRVLAPARAMVRILRGKRRPAEFLARL
jgi:hypothetical protein